MTTSTIGMKAGSGAGKGVAIADVDVFGKLSSSELNGGGVRCTFAEALQHFPDGSVDLLHIDGRHFYEDVKEDYESWLPKLSDRAVVLLTQLI